MDTNPLPSDFILWQRRRLQNPRQPELIWCDWTGEYPIPGWRIELDYWYFEIMENVMDDEGEHPASYYRQMYQQHGAAAITG